MFETNSDVLIHEGRSITSKLRDMAMAEDVKRYL
jgi:hypothetical protein